MHAEQPIRLTGSSWRRGFRSLWRKEFGEWWRTRKWLVNLLIWILALNGILALVSYATQFDPEETAPLLQLQIELLLNLGASATAIGIMVQMQSSMIGERQTGTAAWILSKPVSRAALILAKFGANAVSFLGLATLLPMAIGYVEIRLLGETPSIPAYLGAIAILLLHTLFYLTLTLMLSTFFASRGPVLGISLGTIFASNLLVGVLPAVGYVTPFGLTAIGMGLFGFAPLPAGYPVPLLATLLWSVLFLVIAIRRFNQEEL